MILELEPNLPEYLVDICIAVHPANPLLYRDKKFNSSKGGNAVKGKIMTDNKCDNKNECLDWFVKIENVVEKNKKIIIFNIV